MSGYLYQDWEKVWVKYGFDNFLEEDAHHWRTQMFNKIHPNVCVVVLNLHGYGLGSPLPTAYEYHQGGFQDHYKSPGRSFKTAYGNL